MNEHDSERIAGLLIAQGMEAVDDIEAADVVVLNTCCIRENADDKFYGHLGRLKELKDRRPDLQIAVGGCLAQKDRELIVERAGHVDVVFGTHNLARAPELLIAARASGPIVEITEEHEVYPSTLPTRREVDHSAWVTIQIGCDNSCAFCIVPSVRGREVSRRMGDIVHEVEELAADGVREITLLGQNVNSYGRDLRPLRASFAQLLGQLDAIDGLDRIRYTSPHPKDMREDVIRAHAELPSLCEHIHLPLQSGSSRILRAMRRTYDRERYLDRVALIRQRVPDVALTTDIIVGFPGETEADFEQTLSLVEQVSYDGAFTFIFSPRRGTEAAMLTDGIVPHAEKVARMERLVALVQRGARERAQRFVGRTVEVLVEGTSRTDPDRLRGRTRHNKVVNFSGLARPGELALVDVHSATSQTLAGEERLLARAG
jgi:tRNA-2-methylthio-N6-dimethylallyladenosine synthase